MHVNNAEDIATETNLLTISTVGVPLKLVRFTNILAMQEPQGQNEARHRRADSLLPPCVKTPGVPKAHGDIGHSRFLPKLPPDAPTARD